MSHSNKVPKRFIFHTQGVCPPEIHFELNGDVLEEVRFMGGGCPGNASLVSRLLKGRPVDEILPVLAGIGCREKTSCPDQLSVALQKAMQGTLEPADTVRLRDDPEAHDRVGLVGALNGNTRSLEKIMDGIARQNVGVVYCLGNFTGKGKNVGEMVQRLRAHKNMISLQGENDWDCANNMAADGSLSRTRDRDWIAMLPQMATFRLGPHKAVAFYGDYLQNLPGFSDFAPYALEINMVCGLADFMEDASVFPALEAMTPQFDADVVLFGQSEAWGHWRVGGKEFLGVGFSGNRENATWGLLESTKDGLRFTTVVESR